MTKTLTLRSFDMPQLYKFGIGFDTLFDELQHIINLPDHSNYPPHNVIKTGEHTSAVEIAVAGFADGEIDISLDKKTLTVSGSRKTEGDQNWEYLHRGISSRDFTRTFTLADHVEVQSATIKHGILSVYLERKVPESDLPKSIAITYQN